MKIIILENGCKKITKLADGHGGMKAGVCKNRQESSPMNTINNSLALMNYFRSASNVIFAYKDSSALLLDMVNTCYRVARRRWPNYIVVDF